MAIRERIKKAFKSSTPSATPKGSPQLGKDGPEATWPSNVYAPGEPMPRPKYRAPVKKEHKDRLDAFNFGDAWRRRSHVSLYSPMGSRLPSRKNSVMSRKNSVMSRRSFGGKSRKSIGGASVKAPPTRDGAESTGKDSEEHGDVEATEPVEGGADSKRFKAPHGAARPTRLSVEVEQDGDDDVTNVGLSRVNSHNALPPNSKNSKTTTNGSKQPPPQLSTVTSYDHTPFTEEDLALAMKRSHLTVPTH